MAIDQPSVVAIETPGLGNRTYLIGAGETAVAVDVPRDAWRVAHVAQEHGWRISHALETHMHNDYLSGALELRAAFGSAIVAPAKGGYRFACEAASEDYEVEVVGGGLVALATPGHTSEHLSWELQDGAGRPLALFSGGSLLVGGVGRTDLLGASRVAELTAAQFRTLRRLAELPDDLVVYPTHGSGSFCVAGDRTFAGVPTIGALKRWNPAFGITDAVVFARQLEAGRTRYPSYYAYMAPLNRGGPAPLGGPPVPRPLSVAEVEAAQSTGIPLVDARDRRAFAAGHIRGALNIELGESFAAYVGWLLPFDSPLCLVVEDPSDEVTAVEELRRIGFDHVQGHLQGGIEAWAAAGGETASYGTTDWRELLDAAAEGGVSRATRILDVRQPSEWQEGVVPGSRQVFVADLPAALATLERDRPWLVACRTGIRATIAASLLDAADIPVRLVVDGGVDSLPAAELGPMVAGAG
jgi:glyoxylase-like metal-dependent hydrolase (beta-lactamase superfamily II)/rhodanese-related sulfurtransferase